MMKNTTGICASHFLATTGIMCPLRPPDPPTQLSHSTIPKTATELCPQYEALCCVLNLDLASPTTLATLRDPTLVPATALMHVIETDSIGVENGTYRGCLDGSWIPVSLDPMAWQRSSQLTLKLREKGMTSIAIGDLSEEWYLYVIAHPWVTT
ncbi:hypothetical protein BU15DRAFT_64708 [Melanogaster broomeanus]|nr:hypothetical protein BU15DRAFT_64708 [Melanogaster broomeanus]